MCECCKTVKVFEDISHLWKDERFRAHFEITKQGGIEKTKFLKECRETQEDFRGLVKGFSNCNMGKSCQMKTDKARVKKNH